MCAKIQQSFKDLLKTVEGVDYTERVLTSENVAEKWPSSNSHNFCKNLIIINKKSHAIKVLFLGGFHYSHSRFVSLDHSNQDISTGM
jgi:hypothetical protein